MFLEYRHVAIMISRTHCFGIALEPLNVRLRGQQNRNLEDHLKGNSTVSWYRNTKLPRSIYRSPAPQPQPFSPSSRPSTSWDFASHVSAQLIPSFVDGQLAMAKVGACPPRPAERCAGTFSSLKCFTAQSRLSSHLCRQHPTAVWFVWFWHQKHRMLCS